MADVPSALSPATAPEPALAPLPPPVAAKKPTPPVAKARREVAVVAPAALTPRSRPAATDTPFDGPIAAALDDGAQCFNQKKYDCAIANANTVLHFAPGNRQAIDMKRRAKEAQDKALSSIQIQ